jgi:hypothetical protein
MFSSESEDMSREKRLEAGSRGQSYDVLGCRLQQNSDLQAVIGRLRNP